MPKKPKNPTSIIVPIQTFAPAPFELLKPLYVVIERYGQGEGFLSGFFDANIHSSGDTETEAFDNLKEHIVFAMSQFERIPDKKLGPAMKQQKLVLYEFIKRTK